jgi:NADPH:quinone reductase-like Zn-dependent oxidoreductase
MRTQEKFLKALVPRSRKFVFTDVKSDNLQHVVDLAAAGTLAIPVAQTISLAQAPALLTSLEQGKRLSGKAVIAF